MVGGTTSEEEARDMIRRGEFQVGMRPGEFLAVQPIEFCEGGQVRALSAARLVATAHIITMAPGVPVVPRERPVHWFDWLSFLPPRVNNEAVGDAIESLTRFSGTGAPSWHVRAFYVWLIAVIVGEWIRYGVRCFKGKAAP